MSALYKTGTVAWIRIAKDSEWILAYARDYTWVYLLAGTTRLGNGSISPLTAPAQIRIVQLPDATEPEDKDDLYVEPEPLKEDDAVLLWARIVDAKPDSDGEVEVSLWRADGYQTSYATTYTLPDAIVRPAAGDLPPWLVESAKSEAEELAAVIGCEHHGAEYGVCSVCVEMAERAIDAGWRRTEDGAS